MDKPKQPKASTIAISAALHERIRKLAEQEGMLIGRLCERLLETALQSREDFHARSRLADTKEQLQDADV